mmetsp:Transcript_530/g.1921  ORF Transcript_530/g.1921 Transcript_530/m.1921 type:complete len:333 (-) Transcript_530:4-1002(-)
MGTAGNRDAVQEAEAVVPEALAVLVSPDGKADHLPTGGPVALCSDLPVLAHVQRIQRDSGVEAWIRAALLLEVLRNERGHGLEDLVDAVGLQAHAPEVALPQPARAGPPAALAGQVVAARLLERAGQLRRGGAQVEGANEMLARGRRAGDRLRAGVDALQQPVDGQAGEEAFPLARQHLEVLPAQQEGELLRAQLPQALVEAVPQLLELRLLQLPHAGGAVHEDPRAGELNLGHQLLDLLEERQQRRHGPGDVVLADVVPQARHDLAQRVALDAAAALRIQRQARLVTARTEQHRMVAQQAVPRRPPREGQGHEQPPAAHLWRWAAGAKRPG